MRKYVFLLGTALMALACAEEKVVAPPPECDESTTTQLQFSSGKLAVAETDDIKETYKYVGNTMVYTRLKHDTILQSKHYYFLQNNRAQMSIDTQHLSNGSLGIVHHHYFYQSGRISRKETATLLNNGNDTGSTSTTEYSYYVDGNLRTVESDRPGVFDASARTTYYYRDQPNPGSLIREYHNPILGINASRLPVRALVKESFKEEVEKVFTYEFSKQGRIEQIASYWEEGNQEFTVCENFRY